MRDFFRRHVAHNFGLKVLSLILAVGLWLAVAHDQPAEIAVEVPIEFHNMPANMEISSENVSRVQIRLSGPARVVHRLQPSDVYAEVDLNGLNPGERTFDLTDQQVHHPHGFEVVQIIPSEFHVAFDRRVTRQVEVHPRVIGTFAAGYGIKQIVVDPSKVSVSGPQARVETVDAAITDPIDVSGTMDRATFQRHAYVSDPLIQVVHAQPVRVTVIMEKVPANTTDTKQKQE
ncbi:MAG TPA: CdaR family protein [Terriglobales bacterium]|nr:CdaR family protein [Terriglobales bacterium]